MSACSCGAPGAHLRAALTYYCDHCLALIRERVILREGIAGVGVRDGRNRPEFGVDAFELRCVDCGATWVGPIGEECAYCDRALAQMVTWQRELLLTPELPDDEGSRVAWAERLGRAVTTGLVTEAEARQAIAREERRASH
jgi:hypothetical protein